MDIQIHCTKIVLNSHVSQFYLASVSGSHVAILPACAVLAQLTSTILVQPCVTPILVPVSFSVLPLLYGIQCLFLFALLHQLFHLNTVLKQISSIILQFNCLILSVLLIHNILLVTSSMVIMIIE